MSSAKILIPVALLAAMAAATYSIQSRTTTHRAMTAISVINTPAAKPAQTYDDAMADTPSSKQWPSLVDF